MAKKSEFDWKNGYLNLNKSVRVMESMLFGMVHNPPDVMTADVMREMARKILVELDKLRQEVG